MNRNKLPDLSAAPALSGDWDFFETPSGAIPDSAMAAGAENPAAILGTLRLLEQSVAAHSEWLKNWHLQIVAGLGSGKAQNAPPPQPDLAAWRQAPHRQVLIGHPAYEEIGGKLQMMRAQASRIAEATRRTGVIPPDEYGQFMTTVLEFNKALRQLQNDTWNRLVNIDPLTGLGNRKAMWRRLGIECDRHARSWQPCCIAMLDIDFFKTINDTRGHSVGDLVLRNVATMLAGSLRPYDAVFRYGGEEFLLCLPNADRRTAWGIVERLRLKIASSPIPIGDADLLHVTLSTGVALLSSLEGVEAALRQADAALYAAKRAGRNCVYVWTDASG